jgi:hypothetical protein
MKKAFITLFALAIFSSNASAQLEKGAKLIGGNLGLELTTSKNKYGGTTTTSGKLSSITLEPKFGYFLINNLAVGGELGISGYNWKPEDEDLHDTSGSTISIGPFIRYYSPVNIFVEGKYAIGLSQSEYQDGFDLEEEEYKIRKVVLAIGYAAFLKENVAIEPMFGYQSIAQKARFGESEITLDNSLFIRVGLQVYMR